MGKSISLLLSIMLFIPLISCDYNNFDLSAELNKFKIPKGTKYIMQNSILSPTNIKFLDTFGKELDNVNINIEGFSQIERDNDNIYFLHSELDSKAYSDKKKLPTIDVKYNIQSNLLEEFNTPSALDNCNLLSLVTTHNNDVVAIYDKITPNEPISENIIYNITTNEIISENLYNVTSVEKIDNTYYILCYFANSPEDQGYKLLSIDLANKSMSTLILNLPSNSENTDGANPLKYSLLVLNNKLHVLSPNGTISVLEKDKLVSISKLTDTNSPEFVATAKSNGEYAYISVQDAIYNKNSTTKKYFILDKNYNIREISNNTNLITDDSTVELFNDKFTIFTQTSNTKDIQNTNFYILEYPLDTLEGNIIDMTSLYKPSDTEIYSFVPSKPIEVN